MSGLPLSRRAVVFDMDGLMLDTEPIYRRAWQRAAGELGHPIDDATYLRFVGRRDEDCECILREISVRLTTRGR